MFESAMVYTGLVLALAGAVLAVRPIRRLGVTTRRRGLLIAGSGVLLALIGLVMPSFESRVSRTATRLDEFAPAWQFHERHTIRIAAPPERVYAAVRQVRADEILLFRTLTAIRRGGRPLPPGILNPGTRASLIAVALRGGFVLLAEDVPRELVIGTVIAAPPGTRGTLTPQVFRKELPPGFVLATMNFAVAADGPGRSFVSTETRVFANSPAARRTFAAYWR
ncbi:MAG: hypothetical protein ABIS67_13050, partial [Candidatus Eisenbacteria bacterium]